MKERIIYFKTKSILFFRYIKISLYKFLAKQAMKVAIWESKQRGTAYAVGGTKGWNWYVYFSSIR